jgi:hypothetical protein
MGLGNWLRGAVDVTGDIVGGAFDYFTDFDFSDPSSTGFAEDVLGLLKDDSGNINWGNLIALGASAAYGSGTLDKVFDKLGLDFLKSDANAPPVTGYQGGIPEYQAVQYKVPQLGEIPKPGDRGRRYFTDVVYAQKPAGGPPTLEEAQQQGIMQALTMAGLPVPDFGAPGGGITGGGTSGGTAPLSGGTVPASGGTTPPSTGGGLGTGPVTDETFYGNPSERPQLRAAGGLLGLAKGGYYLGGPTDGMADKVPARIDGRQEARLSDGEFVVPADVVSHLGNGNSNAGAQQLYAMMDKVRQDRTGRKEQGKQINPKRYMPGMGA